jgi:eukaryotic-like serine/threonine-protein kinase
MVNAMPDWNPKANDIFVRAAEIQVAAERRRFVDRECNGDLGLLEQVESLLDAGGKVGSFLEEPAAPGLAAGAATVVSPPVLETAGTAIGAYKLLQQIGEGGMGIVYMAEQQEPVRRKVALKIIKPGMDSAQVIARFEAERQALAMMEHQNIARVFDAGTTETGRPYFVMELVHGVALTTFCDERRLTLRQRLELFIPVCQAIQHAHQKGIIHRDIKPSNVLVTMYDDRPVPKVIDFGIAKATDQRLTERTMFTHFGTMVGTFEYMSPEQAEMNAFGVDTRSDVYSLGVMLYELLTGTTPLEKSRLREAAFNELVRLIKEEEPPRPSVRLSKSGQSSSGTSAGIAAARNVEPAQLPRLVRGDLDWIVMRCLEKQRDRRYETAVGLARDIERYLADEPIEARPPSAAYRMKKFVRRNKGRVVAAALLVLALLMMTAVTTKLMFLARFQENIARQAAEDSERARAAAENERDQKERERKRADANAADFLAEKERADQKAVEAQAAAKRAEIEKDQKERERKKAEEEGRRADTKAAEAQLNEKLLRASLIDFKQEHAAALAEKDRAEKQLLRSEWLLYASQIAAAQREWEMNNDVAAWQQLNSCRADFRGWEHDYLYTMFTRHQLRTIRGHSGAVLSVAVSPDGKRIASRGFDGTLRVWDAASGRELLAVHIGVVDSLAFNSLAFSPDGKRIASGGSDDDKSVRIWDAATGRRLLTLKGHTEWVRCVAYSRDGKRIASGSDDHTVKVWDAESGKELLSLTGHRWLVTGVAFSPDGKRVASIGNDDVLQIWDATNGEETITIQGRTGYLWSMAYSPDGKRIVCGNSDGTLTIWDVASGEEKLTLKGHAKWVHSVAYSPDGRRIVSGSEDNTLKIWDAASGREAPTLRDRGGHHPERHRPDAASGRELFTLRGHTAPVQSVAFSPDGKRVVSGSEDTTLRVWDVTSGDEPLSILGFPPLRLTFSPDGKRIVSADYTGTIAVRDAANGGEMLTLQGVTGGVLHFWSDARKGYDRTVANVAVSPDGKRIVSGSLDRTLKVWDATSGRALTTIKGHSCPVYCVACSPDGKHIASGGQDGMVTMWDLSTGRELAILRGHVGHVTSLAFSPDGRRIASGSDDNTIRVWDSAGGTALLTLFHATVTSVAFSPDGKRIAGGSTDHTIRVWDAASGHEMLTLRGHTNQVLAVAFSPDGKRIASASGDNTLPLSDGNGDNTVRLWDATTGQETLTLRGHTEAVNCLAFSPDGKRIASGSYDNTLKIWDATKSEAARTER